MNTPRRLLLLNRRDFLSPVGGGAEVYLREMAAGFLERGWAADWFCSRFRGAPSEEKSEGIRIIRRGGEAVVHALGRLFVARHGRRYDAIIDSFNGVGFFSAGHARGVLMVFQLYGREFWDAEYPWAGAFLNGLERRLLRGHRRRPCITISPSTRRDLEGLGFRDITIVPVGLSAPMAQEPAPLDGPLRLVYVGRLRATKNPADAIEAFARIREQCPEAQMAVIGQGPQEAELRARYGQMPGLEFAGFLSDAEKFERVRRAHACLIPSLREGWNMVVTECAAAGTCCVGYRVPGVEDSIRHGETGLLVPARDVGALAKETVGLYRDSERLERFRRAAIAWAGQFRWEISRRLFYDAVCGRVLSDL